MLLSERATERGRARGCRTRCRAETIDRAGSTASVIIKSPRETLKELFLHTRALRTSKPSLERAPPIVSGDGRGLSPKCAIKKLPPTSARRTEAARHQATQWRRADDATHTRDSSRSGGEAAAQPCAACRGMFEQCSNAVRTERSAKREQSKGKPFDILT